MKRFVLPSPPGPDSIIRLYGEDYHYLVRVRRLKAGMCFDAALPGGTETKVHILSTEGNTLTGECLEAAEEGLELQTYASKPPPKLLPRLMPQLPPIALFQGLPKGSKMDLIVRQAAEGGVSIIAPFESEYSTTRLNNSPTERTKRWERIVREARQQSGSSIETKVLPPCGFETLLEHWESYKKNYERPLGILLHQDPIATSTGCCEVKGGSPLAKGSFHDYLGRDPDFVALAVGPEGGFSPKEVSFFLAAGWKPLVMGNTILKTETAALYGTAAIRIILSENKTWTPCLKESCS